MPMQCAHCHCAMLTGAAWRGRARVHRLARCHGPAVCGSEGLCLVGSLLAAACTALARERERAVECGAAETGATAAGGCQAHSRERRMCGLASAPPPRAMVHRCACMLDMEHGMAWVRRARSTDPDWRLWCPPALRFRFRFRWGRAVRLPTCTDDGSF